MRNYVKRLSFVLSLVVMFVNVFSLSAFAADVSSSESWDDIPTIFWQNGEKNLPEPVPADPIHPEYDETEDGEESKESEDSENSDDADSDDSDSGSEEEASDSPEDGIETGKNAEDGPGDYFELSEELAGAEELASGEEIAESVASDEGVASGEEITDVAASDEEVTSGEEIAEETFEVAGMEDEMAELASTVRKEYQQPSFYVKAGYDAISVFITSDTSSTSYEGKVYFIYNGSQWLLYNYEQATADLYFDKVEDVNGLKVPSKKADTRADNPYTTGIDESKIPTMTRTSFNGMYCNWRNFADVPLTKSNGSLVYATYETQESGGDDGKKEDGKKEEEKTTVSSSNYYRYTVTLDNGHVYRIYVTSRVSYNGTRHVLSTAKSGKKKTNDIKVYVYLNGQLVEPKLYKVKFKNNLNCTGYGSNEKVFPYIRIKFKFKNKDLKGDIKAMWKKGFRFNILPLDISKGTISYKKVKGDQLKKATVTISGNTMKLNPPKGSKGDYTLTNENGQTMLVGKNNFFGKLALGAVNIYSSGTGNTGVY